MPGLIAPKESSQDVGDLTDGYQPSQIGYKAWELWDEFGNEFEGLLTHDTKNAPMTFSFGHRRYVDGAKHVLTPAGTVHSEQMMGQFEFTSHDMLESVKVMGCKITTIQEMKDRAAKKEGKVIDTKTPTQYRRLAALNERRPPVPQVALPPMSPPACGVTFSPLATGIPLSPGSPQPSTDPATTSIVGVLSQASLDAHLQNVGSVAGLGGAKACSPPLGGGSPEQSDAGRSARSAFVRKGTHSMEQLDTATVCPSVDEEIPPPSLGPKARWEWKLRQLDYTYALGRNKKMGRERNTADDYAGAADLAGEGKVAVALRLKKGRHQLCEQLAWGGFQSREFESLKGDLTAMKLYVDDWTVHSQKEISKRFVAEACGTVGWLRENWGSFQSMTYGWPLPGDVADTKWDPENPMNRFSAQSADAKFSFFLELLSEHAIQPAINTGAVGHQDLLDMLAQVAKDVDEHSEALTEDENAQTHLDVLEAVLTRVKGVAALISRDHGYLKSSKRDATFIRQEAESAQSGMYNALCKSEYYAPFVAEYWRTIEVAEKKLPALRKRQLSIQKLGKGGQWSLADMTALKEAVTEIVELKPHLRETQTNSIQKVVEARASMFASFVVVKAADSWVKDHVSDVDGLLSKFSPTEAQQSETMSLARTALSKLSNAAKTSGRLDALTTHCTTFAGKVDSCTTIADFDVAWTTTDVKDLSKAEVKLGGAADEALKVAIAAACKLLNNDVVFEGVSFCNKGSTLKFEALLTHVLGLSGLAPSCPELTNVQDLVLLLEPMNSLIAYVATGDGPSTRLQADQNFESAKGAASGRINIQEFLAAAAVKPSFVVKFLEQAVAVMQETGTYLGQVHKVHIATAITTLDPIKKVPSFTDVDGAHFLDSFEVDPENVNAAELVEHCQATLFTVDPEKFQQALSKAVTARDAANTAAEVFDTALPVNMEELQNIIDVSEVTKAENIMFGILSENLEKPIRLKRGLKNHVNGLASGVYAQMHACCSCLFESVCGAAAAPKEAKVD